jgi:hypothetical protein
MDYQEKSTAAGSRQGNYSHAYIIWGGSEAERMASADKLAAAIICSGIVNNATGKKPCMSCPHCEKSSRHIHPDIIIIDRLPDTRLILVDQIRALMKDAAILPNEAEKKVYIIMHAGTMNTSAQNALLKQLEEPPLSASFILVTENPAALLPTVRSRCVELQADRQKSSPDVKPRADVNAFYDALTDSPLTLARFSFTLEKHDKNDFIEFLDGAKAFMTLRLKERSEGKPTALTPDYMMKVVEVLDRAKEYLEYNVSLGHIAGMISAELTR